MRYRRTSRVELDRLGVDIIGLNCSVGPQTILDAIERMAAVTSRGNCRRSPMPECRGKWVDVRCIWQARSTWRRTRVISFRPVRRLSVGVAARRRSTFNAMVEGVRPLWLRVLIGVTARVDSVRHMTARKNSRRANLALEPDTAQRTFALWCEACDGQVRNVSRDCAAARSGDRFVSNA